MDKKEVTDIVLNILKVSFKDKRVGDTATDALQLTSRKYVDFNGKTSGRPRSSIAGQQYFDTTIGRPVFWNPSIMTWVDGAGSVS